MHVNSGEPFCVCFFGGEVYKNLRICRPRSDFSRSSREIFIRLIDDYCKQCTLIVLLVRDILSIDAGILG